VVWDHRSEGKFQYVAKSWDNHDEDKNNHVVDVNAVRLVPKEAPNPTTSVDQRLQERKYVDDLMPICGESVEKIKEQESPCAANSDQENIQNATPSKAAPDPTLSVGQYPQEPNRTRPPTHVEVFARAFPWYFPSEGITNPCDLPSGGISLELEGCRFR
jgi:hypothetical protein